jgi:hypothetical protein
LFVFLFLTGFSQDDLPHPFPHLESIPAGSYVIPMDTLSNR